MLTAMLYDLWTAIRAAQARRRTLAELSALDDRLLRDIGLSRGGIWHAVRGAPPTREPTPASAAHRGAPARPPCAPAAAGCR